MNNNKPFLPKLKPLTGNQIQWQAFCEMIDYAIEMEQRKLEQAGDLKEIFQAQGAVMKLRQLKKLKDEVDASK
jgi:hypothetical protein